MVEIDTLGSETTQVVDPAISKMKFFRELKKFRNLEEFYRSRGVVLIRAAYPEMVFSFWTFNMRPVICVLAVKVNFTNYDVEAPSITFVDPLTDEPLTEQQLPVLLWRRRLHQPATDVSTNNAEQSVVVEKLIQSHAPDHIPFLCIAGVREYHDHPFHTNDPWLTHRGQGEGTLDFLLEQFIKYGTEPIRNVQPAIAQVIPVAPSILQVHVQGLSFNPTDINNIPT